MALPFADGSFDLVLCQQMLQFVSDRTAALAAKFAAVLSPGGPLPRQHLALRGEPTLRRRRARPMRSTRSTGSPTCASRRSP